MVSKIQQEDILEFARTFALADGLTNASFLITGATGLIGSSLIRCLLALDKNIRIVAPIRNKVKAKALFYEIDKVDWVECDLTSYAFNQIGVVDFIIHCASPTNGKFIVEHPAETFELAVESTRNLLRYSLGHSIKSFVYVSSLEAYGENSDDRIVDENMQFYIGAQSPRSAYPLGKRAAEYLCSSYAMEYSVPAKSVRLTQTFGAGVSKEDNRVYAQFARSVVSGTDLVLHTRGESAKPYCYLTDAVSAILYVLLKGINGAVYNVANESSYISVKNLACFLRDTFNPQIEVRVELNDTMGYAPLTKLNLSTEKMRSLGWQPYYDLKQMFERLIAYLSE
ncbi:MAG: NAD(P)-dependent oxidoreductase [Bacteroidales bacterium]|nr:NAD(P)-dependent oxidoreductase [Bacteroidales bacterium]